MARLLALSAIPSAATETLPSVVPASQSDHAEHTVTVTVTQTPTFQTVTHGKPWTTATALIHTRPGFYPSESPVVVKYYPPQPQQVQCQQVYRPIYHCNKTGAIVGSFFGGLGAGLLVCAFVLFFMIRKNNKLKRRIDAMGGAGDEAGVTTADEPSPSRFAEKVRSIGTFVLGGERPLIRSAVVTSIGEIASNWKQTGPIRLPDNGEDTKNKCPLIRSAVVTSIGEIASSRKPAGPIHLPDNDEEREPLMSEQGTTPETRDLV